MSAPASSTLARPVLGYGTNGFADHPLDAALDVIQANGYGAVALTLGHPHFDASAHGWLDRAIALRDDLERRGLRVAFLVRAVEVAEVIGADCVSLWAGVRPEPVEEDAAWARLVDRMSPVVTAAREHGVPLGFEPEPGMLVETVADALRLRADLGDPPEFGLTVDLGHCVVVEPDGVDGALRAAGDLLVNVQVDDMRPHAHEHLELGTGDLDLDLAFRTLADLGYAGVAAVELPRHSHAAPRCAEESMARLTDVMERIGR